MQGNERDLANTPVPVQRTHYDSEHGIQEFQLFQNVDGNLEPGLKVVIKNAPDDIEGSAAFFNLLVDCGSRNENLDQLGGAHLLEHACFLGLGGDPSGDVHTYFWTRQGARDNNNAFTTVNAINYSAETEPEHYAQLLETFKMMLAGENLQHLDEQYLKQEQQNVVSEHRRGDNASESARRAVVTATGMVNRALGLHNAAPTIGREEVYTAMTKEDLIALHKQCFCPSRATLVVCGLQDEQGEFLNLVMNTLGQVPINTEKSPLQAPMPTMRTDMDKGQRMQIIQSGNAATYVALATAYPDMVQGTDADRALSHAKRVTLDVLHELLLPSGAGHQSSGLLQELFKTNLVYQGVIMPAQSGYASPSVLLMAVPSDVQSEAQRVFAVQSKVGEIFSYVLPKFSQFTDAGERLEAAKQRVKDNDANLINGDLREISDALLQGVRYRNSDYFFNRHKHVDNVTTKMIEDVVKTVWSPERQSIVVHSQHGMTFDDTKSQTAFNENVVSRFQIPKETPLNTYHYEPKQLYAPFLLAKSIQTSENGINFQHKVKPYDLAEVRITYAKLAQTIDNYEKSKIMAEAINRLVNRTVAANLAADANVQITATPSVLGFHVGVRAKKDHIYSAVKSMKQCLSNVSEQTVQKEISNLVSSHLALLNGSSETDADGIARQLLASTVFTKSVVGYTTPSYDDRRKQLQEMHSQSQVLDVIKTIQSLAQKNAATCYSTLNAQSINVQSLNHVDARVQNHDDTTQNLYQRNNSTTSNSTLDSNIVASLIEDEFAPIGRDRQHVQQNFKFPTHDEPHEKFVAKNIANTKEITFHMWVMLPKVKIKMLKEDMQNQVCCEIFTQTLGNGFGGDMMRTLRGQYGLTYGTTTKLQLGGMLNDQAHPILQCTATFKPDDFATGVQRMTEVMQEAMTNELSSEKFAIAKESLKTQYTRSAANRHVVASLMLSHQMLGTDHDRRAKLCGVDFHGQDSKSLDFDTYERFMTSILPSEKENIQIYGAAVGTGAEEAMNQYKNPQSKPNSNNLQHAQPQANFIRIKLRL
tara:strand:+ start:2363 stop:5485 length:3123 start_codon:yes stop_codon:yes gene_type:complete